MTHPFLDQEEKELLQLFETNKLKRSEDAMQEKRKAMVAAGDHFKKTARVNIRLSPYDLDGFKRVAARKGLPYQTLMASILHQYIEHWSDRA